MSLNEYVKKRNFKETTEPESGVSKSKGKLKFVVQRHHASHLHYDFRLELDGVLKSWAIPKGPSLNPKDKRLAMMVEDHPYDYRTFEGVIPEGNYGAGVVTIFDEGTYESLIGAQGEKELRHGLKSGNLKFRLFGKILKGEFALVKLKGAEDNSWLLIKHRDEHAVEGKFNSEDLVSEKIKKKGIDEKKKAKTPKSRPAETAEAEDRPTPQELDLASFRPMLARLASASQLSDDPDWIYERKLDGYRAIAFTGKELKLVSRNNIEFENKYKRVKEALSAIKAEAIIDGELVAEDKNGKSTFQKLQNYASAGEDVSLKYYVFDLLALNGHDLRDLELTKRKQLLAALVEKIDQPAIVYNGHIEGKGKALFKEASENNWEGIIAKDGCSTYESNRRSDHWLKFKISNSQEAVIIGYSKPDGSRKYFGSLVLAMYKAKKLVYIGNCGTGFDEATLKDVYSRMSNLGTVNKPVSEKVHRERDVTWIKPLLVCEVTFSEWTADGHLRHPVFKGLRKDKNASEVIQEVPSPPFGLTKSDQPPTSAKKRQDTSGDQDKTTSKKQPSRSPDIEEKFGKIQLMLTNPDKLYWKKENISKGQLIEYYRSVSKFILPYLKDRPLSLNRHPNGIDAPGFFQKDLDLEQVPSWIKSTPMHSESNNKDIDYLICNDLPTLLWMVNLGCIEINPWLSSYKKPENPVFAVMDLDPNDVDDFTEVVRVALTVREILEQSGVKPYIKTSGSRGLHIFMHLGAKYDYEISKNFVHLLGQMVHQRHPDSTSLERSPGKRKKQIYLDFLQNRRGQTIAAPYSARPKPGATVSTPLEWDEVNESLNIKAFTIFNTQERLNEKGDLWEAITKEKADLKSALKRLRQ